VDEILKKETINDEPERWDIRKDKFYQILERWPHKIILIWAIWFV